MSFLVVVIVIIIIIIIINNHGVRGPTDVCWEESTSVSLEASDLWQALGFRHSLSKWSEALH